MRARATRSPFEAQRFDAQRMVLNRKNGVHDASSRWFNAMSKTSKLRRRLPARRDSKPSRRAVEQERHVLLGHAAMRAQRHGRGRTDRAPLRRVPSTRVASLTTTRSPMRSFGSSKRSHAAALSARFRCPAMPRCAPRIACASTLNARQIDRRERSERAVMHDVGIGDRQDHARVAARRASRRAGPADRSRSARRLRSCFAFMP